MGKYKFWSLLLVCSLAATARAEVRTVLSSAAPGPTVLLVTDAAATDFTADVAVAQVGAWTLTKGKVMTCPAAELPAAAASAAPDTVVVLRNVRSARTVAQVEARGLDAGPLLDALNALTDPAGEKLSLAAADAATTRPATTRPAAPATDPLPAGTARALRVTLVIKNGGTAPAARTRLFRHAVHHVLAASGMTASDPWTLVVKRPGAINVALYAGPGSNATPGVTAFPKIFGGDPQVQYSFVGPAELRHPRLLEQFDVMFFCGGMSNAQGNAIGKDGADAVRAFVRDGGGYVSTCAGSYLATSGFPWSLKIIAADVVDYAHWLRGTGPVDVELTDEGRKIFGDRAGMLSVKYANGPLLGPAKAAADGVAPFTTLAFFRSDMAKSAPPGKMPNTPAIIAGQYGKGRVLCFSPHPEYTPGLEEMIGRAVRWSVDRPVADGK